MFFSLISSFSYGATVVPNHPVYEFLNRMNIRFNKGWFLQVKPWSHKDIEAALLELEKNSTEMSLWERREYHLNRQFFLSGPKHQHSVLGYKKADRDILLKGAYETQLNYQDSLPHSKLYAFGTLGLFAEGNLDSSLGFVSEIKFGQTRSLKRQFFEHYQANWGLPYNTPAKAGSSDSIFKVATFDSYRAVISYYGNFRLDFGNDWNEWGPGIWQHPSFSSEPWFWSQDSIHTAKAWEITDLYYNSPLPYTDRENRNGYGKVGQAAPLPQIRASINWDFLMYTKFIGKRTGLVYGDNQYVSGHKIQFNYRGFSIGAYEAVIFKRDSWDLTYSIPFVSLFVAEHFQGDRDNIALGMDVQYIFKGKYRMYGELFLDDLVSPGEIFTNYWGNKYALSMGTEIVDPLVKNSRLVLEYSRVEPWVFTHVTLDNQYQHLGSLLGSSLPPNSHQLRLSWQDHFEFLRGLKYELSYAFFQNQQLSKGSSIFDNFEAGDSEKKSFLGKNPETRHQISFNPAYSWNRYFEVKGHVGYQYLENWQSQKGRIAEGMYAGIFWKTAY